MIAHPKVAQVPRWWLGHVGMGRIPGSCLLPEAPAHHLGWVQLVSQGSLLAQAESAAVGTVFVLYCNQSSTLSLSSL